MSQDGKMKITVDNDPYWNLMGAIEDMKATGVADKITIQTCERVLKQIKELQEQVNMTPTYSTKNLLSKNPFRE